MKKHTKFAITGLAAVMAVMALTGCATEEEKKAAAKYQAEAETYAEGNNYEAAQESMKKALEQTPRDKELKEASENLDKKAKEMKAYSKTMAAALTAIEADDAKALMDLQKSDAGKALAEMAGDVGNYIYMPDGGTTGKGVGFYSFEGCECDQWYVGDYKDGKREGTGIWYYVKEDTQKDELYKEVYTGDWSKDKPNGKGHQLIASGDTVHTDKNFKVKNGLFHGKYKIKDKLEDGTEVTGTYTLKNGKYVTISDEELTANNFAVPDEPHLAIAFLYDAEGNIKSCTMVYAEDVTEGVAHYR